MKSLNRIQSSSISPSRKPPPSINTNQLPPHTLKICTFIIHRFPNIFLLFQTPSHHSMITWSQTRFYTQLTNQTMFINVMTKSRTLPRRGFLHILLIKVVFQTLYKHNSLRRCSSTITPHPVYSWVVKISHYQDSSYFPHRVWTLNCKVDHWEHRSKNTFRFKIC